MNYFTVGFAVVMIYIIIDWFVLARRTFRLECILDV